MHKLKTDNYTFIIVAIQLCHLKHVGNVSFYLNFLKRTVIAYEQFHVKWDNLGTRPPPICPQFYTLIVGVKKLRFPNFQLISLKISLMAKIWSFDRFFDFLHVSFIFSLFWA